MSNDKLVERANVVAWLRGHDHPPKLKEAATFFAKLIERGEHSGYLEDYYPEDYDLDT